MHSSYSLIFHSYAELFPKRVSAAIKIIISLNFYNLITTYIYLNYVHLSIEIDFRFLIVLHSSDQAEQIASKVAK